MGLRFDAFDDAQRKRDAVARAVEQSLIDLEKLSKRALEESNAADVGAELSQLRSEVKERQDALAREEASLTMARERAGQHGDADNDDDEKEDAPAKP